MTKYKIRKIEKNDYYKSYLSLISQLTNENINCTYDYFSEYLDKINSDIFVIEFNKKIIASITLIIEKKFIHNFKSVCHIEDVIVDKNYFKKGIGSKLIKYSINQAKKENCYKIILNCKNNLDNFYKKFGFNRKNIEMSIYF
jgi:glucosamine-phosphate N-acetyltransferase